MKMSKLISALVVVFLVFSLTLVTSATSSDLAFAVEAPSTVNAGGELVVEVHVVENKAGFNYAKPVISYDTQYLTYVGYDISGGAFADATIEVGTSTVGELAINIGNMMEAWSGKTYTQSGVAVKLTFKVAEGFEKALDFNMVLSAKNIVDSNKGFGPTCALSFAVIDNNGVNEGVESVNVVGENHTHTPGAEATCTTSQICTYCYAELKGSLGHDIVIDKAVAATCTETGLTEGQHCSRCDEMTIAQKVVDALGHTEVIDAKVDATCTKTGLTEGKHCSVCEKVLVAQETIPLADHTEAIDAKVDATCTKTGLTEGKHCSVCNEVLVAQEVLPLIPHTEVTIPRVEPTYSSNGKTEGKKCSVCGTITVKQQTIPALKHTVVVIPGKAATCTETGLTDAYKCTNCGEVVVDHEVIPALGHKEETVAGKAPTCTEKGLTDGTKCSVCGETITAQEEIAATGHKYDNNCDASCNNCSAERDVPDHTYGEWEVTKEAEVGVAGEQKRACTECGHEVVQFIAPLEPEFNFIWIIVGAAALVAVIIVIVVVSKKKK